MKNSEKLSLFRTANQISFGFRDIKFTETSEKLESIDFYNNESNSFVMENPMILWTMYLLDTNISKECTSNINDRNTGWRYDSTWRWNDNPCPIGDK